MSPATLRKPLVPTLVVLALIVAAPLAANVLPDGSAWARWPAETAQRIGAWDTTAPGAEASSSGLRPLPSITRPTLPRTPHPARITGLVALRDALGHGPQ